jgi:hypothetical protein
MFTHVKRNARSKKVEIGLEKFSEAKDRFWRKFVCKNRLKHGKEFSCVEIVG